MMTYEDDMGVQVEAGQGNVHRIRLTVDENKNIDEKLID